MSNKTEQNTGLFKKLLEVKKKVTYIQQDKEGQNYKYASGSAVLGQVNPLLNSQGVFLKTEVLESSYERIESGVREDYKLKKVVPRIQYLYKIKVLYTFIDTDTGATEVNRWEAFGCNDNEKGFGSALTYSERYFFLKYFNIATDKDDPDAYQEKQLTPEQVAEVHKAEEEVKAAARKETVDGWILKINNIKDISKVWKCLTPEEQEANKGTLADLKSGLS